jgi:hypothetical protein
MSDLPDFIPQVPASDAHAAFDPQLPPPYSFDNVQFRVFPLLADKSKLQAICDRFINDVPAPLSLPFTIKPLQSLVLLDVLDYPKMTSAYPGQSELGFSSQRESFFAIPVVKAGSNGVPIDVGLFVPYIFVDNDWSLISGREVVGFPKVNGRIEMPTQQTGAGSGAGIAIRALDQFASGTQSSVQTLVEFESDPIPFARQPASSLTDLGDDTVWPFGPLDRLYGARSSELGLEPVDDAVYQLLLQNAGLDIGVSNYTFKQVRDAEDPDKAAYQQILECEMRMHKFGALSPLSGTKLKIYDFDTLNVGELLGVSSNAVSISPLLQFGHSADMTYAVKQTVYKRCGAAVSLPPDKSCVQLFGEGYKLAKKTAKKQAKLAGNMAQTMAHGRLHPSYYAEDIRAATINLADYSAGVWDLTIQGLGHLFRRRS